MWFRPSRVVVAVAGALLSGIGCTHAPRHDHRAANAAARCGALAVVRALPTGVVKAPDARPSAEVAEYVTSLRRRVLAAWTTPLLRGRQAVELEFAVDGAGCVAWVRVASASTSAAERAVLLALERAQPFGAPPDELAGELLTADFESAAR